MKDTKKEMKREIEEIKASILKIKKEYPAGADGSREFFVEEFICEQTARIYEIEEQIKK